MGSGYLPNSDSGLLAWSTNFSTLITDAPTTYGLTSSDATALGSLLTAYANALTEATEPATRTQVSVAAKNAARAQLKLLIRADVLRIQGVTTVTAAQKLALGITVADRVPTPVPPPATKPVVTQAAMDGRNLEVRLVDEMTPTRRGRPHGVAAAEVYSFVAATPGQTPPTDLEQWRFEGIATRWTFVVDFDPADSGKEATVVARWINGKGQPGPTSEPLMLIVPATWAQAA